MLPSRRIRIALGVALGILFVGYCVKIFLPTTIHARVPVALTVNKGQSLLSISKELESMGIIDSPFTFRMLVSLRAKQHNIPAGVYVFGDTTSLMQPRISLYTVASRLARRDYGYKKIKVTIPEGLNVFDIAQRITAKVPSISALEFASSAAPYEGYLFPETYFISPYATSGEIINEMRTTFNTEVLQNATITTAIASSGHSLAEIITMASILEGEVRTTEDRQLVADLLWRRIQEGMPLQVDSTFTYINQKTSAELTAADLKIDSKYNTYKYRGLPPGPISNPGIDTIMAALNPTKNNYVYFLNDKNGVTHFARTLKEHVQLKNKYLK